MSEVEHRHRYQRTKVTMCYYTVFFFYNSLPMDQAVTVAHISLFLKSLLRLISYTQYEMATSPSFARNMIKLRLVSQRLLAIIFVEFWW